MRRSYVGQTVDQVLFRHMSSFRWRRPGRLIEPIGSGFTEDATEASRFMDIVKSRLKFAYQFVGYHPEKADRLKADSGNYCGERDGPL